MAVRTIRVKVGERWYTVEVADMSTSPVEVTVDGETIYVEVEGLPAARPTPSKPTTPRAPRAPGAGPARPRPAPTRPSDKIIRSPMPARVIAVTVRPGDTVSAGQEVCVLEAMKMEQSIRAPQAGIVKTVHTRPLEQVGVDDPLVELE